MNEEEFVSYVKNYGIFSLEKESNNNVVDFSIKYKYNVKYCGKRVFFFYIRFYKKVLETIVYTEEDNPILLINGDIAKEFIYMCNNFVLKIQADYNLIKKRYYINEILMNYENQIILLNTIENSNFKNIRIIIHLATDTCGYNYYTLSTEDKILDRFYSLHDLLECELLKPFRRSTIGDFKKFFGIM